MGLARTASTSETASSCGTSYPNVSGMPPSGAPPTHTAVTCRPVPPKVLTQPGPPTRIPITALSRRPGLARRAHRAPCGERLLDRQREHMVLAGVGERVGRRPAVAHPAGHPPEQRSDGDLVV